jgi:DNA polymerase I-like protein with 3'-5' exonuclease and polymerase domains
MTIKAAGCPRGKPLQRTLGYSTRKWTLENLNQLNMLSIILQHVSMAKPRKVYLEQDQGRV